MSVAEFIARAKAAGDLPKLAELIPYSKFMGISVAVADGDLSVKMDGSKHLVGNTALPALHGGTIGALLESAALFEVLWRSETVALPKTITLTIEYLRSAKLVDTFARATVTRHGRRVANVRAVAWQEDPERPIAAASVHVLLSPPEDAKAHST